MSFGGTNTVAATDGDHEKTASLRSWAIQKNPAIVEQKLWEAQKVNIYDMDLNDFVAKLEEAE